jgi:hypothetical protein
MHLILQRVREDTMSALNKKNLLVASILTISGVILASSYSDLTMQSTEFMAESTIESSIQRLDEVQERYVASEKQIELPKIVSCPVNRDDFIRMKQDIDGKWMLNKYKYLANNQMDERPFYRKVKLTLLDNCEVMVNDDDEQIFNISFLSEAYTMAVFKLFNEGYEVLELKKVQLVSNNIMANQESASVDSSETEEVVEQEQLNIELALESANTSDGHLKSNLVRGTLEIADGYLNIDAVINFDTNKEKEIRISDAELNGNAFVVNDDENPLVGIITANGNKTSYTIRFSTGEYKGITLNFTTEDSIEEKLEAENFELAKQEELKEEINERPTDGEMVTVAQGRGFAF